MFFDSALEGGGPLAVVGVLREAQIRIVFQIRISVCYPTRLSACLSRRISFVFAPIGSRKTVHGSRVFLGFSSSRSFSASRLFFMVFLNFRTTHNLLTHNVFFNTMDEAPLGKRWTKRSDGRWTLFYSRLLEFSDSRLFGPSRSLVS